MFIGYKNNMEVVYNLIKNKYYHHFQMLPEYIWVSFRSSEWSWKYKITYRTENKLIFTCISEGSEYEAIVNSLYIMKQMLD
jgi:hypothetical protein